MCLGIPGKVIEVNLAENWAVVETFGVRKKISITLVDEEITPGDYLMVHTGYAIGKIDLSDAETTLKLWEEILLAE
ncbi:HypC/HybG/HupF family hydrogenase formation chaperone [Pelotomaculum propionicicum]|uniref:Hydrogenase isoenzymes formation protein HypC n=1 Tax=Pelotomaculum propionicicum TaxID=258475 RepID=A0A4Y7RSR9_9FIRM|nr:HypC/HybG/HupF family hydrogenase formation chaperone [Pelotomaculum propionicicum]NLI12514.1 HypC/HybG/HupF family hydrogenase formation chaperone [Peptococcaceae bacterium]TEB12048.1 Hydrogenase isoenzymes formation protein HypC [Pelotomaculum propionicicum]